MSVFNIALKDRTRTSFYFDFVFVICSLLCQIDLRSTTTVDVLDEASGTTFTKLTSLSPSPTGISGAIRLTSCLYVTVLRDTSCSTTQGLRHDQKPEKGPRHEIDVKQLKVQTGGRSLGAGGFGAVQIGEWRGSRVAVKIIHSRGANRERMVRELRREAAVHQDLQYAFIAQLYGACTKGDNLGLVMELAPGGSLDEYLLNSSNPLDSALQIAFLYDIARGMSFLHEEGILHRDLKSANVLMFENSRLKLCDFGLAKVKEESSGRTGVGTAQWMAPELLMSERGSSSEQSDVYRWVSVIVEYIGRLS